MGPQSHPQAAWTGRGVREGPPAPGDGHQDSVAGVGWDGSKPDTPNPGIFSPVAPFLELLFPSSFQPGAVPALPQSGISPAPWIWSVPEIPACPWIAEREDRTETFGEKPPGLGMSWGRVWELQPSPTARRESRDGAPHPALPGEAQTREQTQL